jgi:hypothetical protein
MPVALVLVQLLVAQPVQPEPPRSTPSLPSPALRAAEDVTGDTTADPVRDDYLRLRSRSMFELEAWGQANLIGSGLAFLAARSPFARGFELQLALWGIGEGAVAVVNLIQAKKEKSQIEGADVWLGLRDETRREHRIESLADLVLLSVALASWRALRLARWRGMAAGIALQAGFLALFNLLSSVAFGS